MSSMLTSATLAVALVEWGHLRSAGWMKRLFDLLLVAVGAATFVLGVEWLVRLRLRRRKRPTPPPRPRSLLRVRREVAAGRVVYNVEGTLTRLSAGLLVSSIELAPSLDLVVVDLSKADRVPHDARPIFSRVLTYKRRVLFRGLREEHRDLFGAPAKLGSTARKRC